MGLIAALDHGAAAYSTSLLLLQSEPLVQQLLDPTEEAVGAVVAEVAEDAPLSPDILATLSIQLSEEVTADSITGLSQKMLSARIDSEPEAPLPKNSERRRTRVCMHGISQLASCQILAQLPPSACPGSPSSSY